MKRLLLAMVITFFAVSAQAADVGVSVRVGEPGFYGRIDIGSTPSPDVIYAKPVTARPPRAHIEQKPVYLRVPPGHEKNWGKHCSKYNACGQPVYFVRDKWYNNVYVPHHRDKNRGYDKKRDNRRDRDDRYRGKDDDRDDRGRKPDRD